MAGNIILHMCSHTPAGKIDCNDKAATSWMYTSNIRGLDHLPLNRTQSGESVFLYQKVAPPARKEAGVRPCPSRIGICNVLQRILKHFVKSHALPTKIGPSAGKHCLTHCAKPTSSASSILMCSLLGPILLILGFFMKMKICRAEVCEPSMLMSAGVIANALSLIHI